MRTFLFPGQGSQAIGMGLSLYKNSLEAKEVFQEVDETLKQKLSRLMFEGDLEELTKTANTQPALMAVSLACVRVLEKQAGKPLSDLGTFIAGHSLGEYAALCAGGTFSLETTAKLLRLRGLAMQEAVPEGVGAMTALIGATLAQAEEIATICAQGQVLEVANDNAPGQVVLSGHLQALERAEEAAKVMGIKRAIRLGVSAPFHSSLMAPAAEKMQEAFENLGTLSLPSLNLVSNVTASLLESKDDIAPRLVAQVTGRVRWVESIELLKAQEVREFVELGSGKVLSGLVKRIDKEAGTRSIETLEEIDHFLEDVLAA